MELRMVCVDGKNALRKERYSKDTYMVCKVKYKLWLKQVKIHKNVNKN